MGRVAKCSEGVNQQIFVKVNDGAEKLVYFANVNYFHSIKYLDTLDI